MPDDGLLHLFTQDEAMDKRRKELMKEAEERKAEAAALKEQERAERGDDDEEEEEEVRDARVFPPSLYFRVLACISASPARFLRVPLPYLRVPPKHHYPVIGIFLSCKILETISICSRTFLRVFVVLLIQST